MIDINEILSYCPEVIRRYDEREAIKLIKELESFQFAQDKNSRNETQAQKIDKLIIYLKLAALPHLTDEDASEILLRHYLDSFDAQIDMENRITGKLFMIPEEPRNEVRKKLKNAILNNQQKLGNLTISQWINEFEKKYPVQSRNLNSTTDFILSDNYARSLDQISKNKLKEIIHVYDYLLVQTLPATGPILNEYLNYPMASNIGDNRQFEIQTPSFSSFNPTNITTSENNKINLAFTEALKKYPDANDQIITANHINLSGSSQPVRPTVKNWLADYTYNLGYDSHDSITRNNYLFQNPNAKMLGPSDREKLSYILKAYDEKTPVAVDTARKQIVFPATESIKYQPPVSGPSTNIVPNSNFQTNIQPAQKDNNFSHTVDLKKSVPENNNPQPLSRPVYQMPKDEEKPKDYAFHKLPEEKNYSPTANINQNNISNNHPNFSTNPASRIGTSQFKPQNTPVEPEKLSFSSPHKLPYEMKEEKKAIPTPTANITENLPELKRNIPAAEPTRPVQPTFSPSVPPKPTAQPLRINPATYDENEEEDLPGNVVNLRK